MRYDLALSIYSGTTLPSIVSQQLGIDATSAVSAAPLVEPIGTVRLRPDDFNAWFLRSEEHVESRVPDEHSAWFFQRLREMAEPLRELTREPDVHAEVRLCVWSKDDGCVVTLDPSDVAVLAQLDLPLRLSFLNLPDADRNGLRPARFPRSSDFDTAAMRDLIRFDIQFLLYPGSTTPREVTTRLDLEPTSSVTAGEVMKSGRVQNLNGWFLRSDKNVASRSPKAHFEWFANVVEKIRPKLESILSVPDARARLNVVVWTEHDGTELWLDPSDLTPLAALDLSIYFEFADYGDD